MRRTEAVFFTAARGWITPVMMLITASALGSLGCSNETAEATTSAGVRDSSGIQIVEYGPEIPPEIERRRLRPTADFTIGKSDQSEYELVQIEAARRLPGVGYLAQVTDGRTFREFRLFDTAGVFRWRFGRPGQGPGEFSSLQSWTVGRGDSLIWWDDGSLRVTVITPDGKLGRDFKMPKAITGPNFLTGAFSDGGLLFRGRRTAHPWGLGYFRDTAVVFRLSADGQTVDTLGLIPSSGIVGAPDRNTDIVFYNPVGIALHDSTMVVGDGNRYELEIHGPRGALRTIIRWNRQPVPVSPEVTSRYNDPKYWSEGMEVMRAAVYDWLKTAVYPLQGTVQLDRLGYIWVRDYDYQEIEAWSTPRQGKTGKPRWTVFNPDGRMIAIVDLDLPGFNILELRVDGVLGSSPDSNDIARLELHRLEKADGTDVWPLASGAR